ncbi:hypothetical protein RRG08_059135 [Elysia crispata]|uniref:Uncharacterized protein n=1 Tax=Elysia crispata TaxID=231223 RepID=A0AAE1CP37_9GAST|nr:hypothetical protein RRG08_059135 [Elysia crispata]
MTIEQTINKHAKSKGGIVGFSRNLPGYYRWSVTRHNRAEYVSATLKMINNRCSDTESHKELNPAEKRSSERRVQKTLLAFSAFINPFEVEDGLVSLASGLKVQEDVADDLLFGTSTTVSRNDCLKLESFVCKLYGKTSCTSVDKARHDIVRQRFKRKKGAILCNGGLDLCQMPPCSQVLSLHILRANFQTLIWRNAVFQNPSIPKPEDNGWQRNSANELEVQWFKDAFIPDELHDIVTEEICTRTDEETYDDDSFDSDFLDDSSEDEEDIATDDEDGV